MEKEEKQKIIEKFATHEKDTGSPQVQVALLTERIKELSRHLTKHKKDRHSRRGLLGLVEKRRKFLSYLKNEAPKRYRQLIKKLGIRK